MDEECYERVLIFVCCKNLPNLDLMSKTDPFCIVDCKTSGGVTGVPEVQRVGISEVQMDNLNPTFATAFEVNYHFELVQTIVVHIYDKDSSAPLSRTSAHTAVGTYTFNLATLMASSPSCSTGKLETRRGSGKATCSVRGETMSSTRDQLAVTFSGKKLANKDGFFGRSDPYMVISRANEDGSYTAVFQNDPIMNNLNPNWPPLNLSIAKICNGDLDRALKIDIWDFDNGGGHDHMGTVMTTVNGLLKADGKGFDVEEIKRKKTVKSGQLFASNVELKRFPSFVEYINGGMEVSMSVAIDFTASNGDPSKPKSLHYIAPGTEMNQYQTAIEYVGRIVAEYDTDKMFPVYGFGAKVGESTTVNHCFPVYGENPEVHGVDGIQKAYRDAISNIKLSGPTLMAPLLRQVLHAHAPACTAEAQRYSIVLILADGVICDMDDTIDCIVELSVKPVSIIIVGVGNADFSQMEALDGDGGLLVSKRSRKTAARDIVQFVQMNNYKGSGIATLASDTLKEVPDQVLSYMKNAKILPNPAPPPYF